LLPTRGGFGPGRGPPGLAPVDGAAGVAADAAGAAGAAGAGVGRPGLGAFVAGAAGVAALAAGAAGAGAAGVGAGAAAAGAAGAGAAGLGPGRGPPGLAEVAGALGAGAPGLAAGRAAESDFDDGNDSRRRLATGASTVEDADFTNSPCSLSVASSSLLVTPSSLANSCTRALPATALLTDEVEQEAPLRGARTTSGYLRWTIIAGASRCAHECLCLFCSRGTALGGCPARTQWSTSDTSTLPDTRRALPNARRLSARFRQSSTGCSHAPRPGSLRPGSGVRT
jgi:hypothetical protein